MKHKSIFISCLVLLFIVGAANGAAHTQAGATFTVDSTTDAVDANPGDGTCATTVGECTLRAAVQEANALAGADTIILPAGTYTLGIPGASEDTAATGDLDITDDLTLTRAGAATTIIDGGGLDRVLHIDPLSAGISAEIDGVTVQNGKAAESGGGIVNRGRLTITNSTISGNTGPAGGAITNSSPGTLTLTNVTISGNVATAGCGGGIVNSGTATLANSTISGNRATSGGGGICNLSAGTLTLLNVTISGNTGGNISAGGMVNFKNTILPDCSGTLNSQGHNLIENTTGCTITGDTTGNIIGQDPQLGPLADNGGPTQTHALLPGSPAIDAGDNTACPATDQRGIARPVDGDGDGTATCDIGAYEYEYAAHIYLPIVLKNYPRADVIFHNGTVLTMEADQLQAQAIAIQGETILAVGSDEEVLALRGPGTQVVDLQGWTLMPGFIDSHAHWIGDRDLAGYATPDEAIQAALENGWTSVSELFVSQDRLDELLALDRDGRLRLRVNAYLPLNWQFDRFGDWYQRYQPGQQFSPRLRVAGVKIFIDSGDRGEKYLSQPYSDNPGYYGTVFWSQDELNDVVREAHQAGFQIAAHTGGDAAHDMILNAFENALQGESNQTYRHRIEHVMILRDDQLQRMRRLGIIASFQLSWFHSDWTEEFESNLGPERVPWAGRWRDLLEAGVPSIGSTDAPWGYGTVGPSMKAIYQAVTRIGEEGLPPPQWMLDQRISVEQALGLITVDAAYGTFQEDVKGSLAAGKLADLVILSENPLTTPPERLMGIQVLMTMVGGRVEYCAVGQEALCPGYERRTPKAETPEPELDWTFDYVREFWPELTRPGDHVAFPLPGRFVVPGGFFDWFFYWDSYFITLGLVVQGKWQLAREVVDNLIYEVEQFGFVPNYNAPDAVCRSRSQPPFLTSAIREVYPYVQDRDWLARAYNAATREYFDYWLAEPHLTPTGLSRYHDTGEDGCITIPDTPHYRAMAESGWDNTPRFGDDVSQVLPVDLNSQLYRYELDLAQFAELLGNTTEAGEWRSRAETRRRLINEYFWDEEQGFYFDYDLRTGDQLRSTPRCLSSYVPLWAGVADETQAARMVEHLLIFEYSHGLVTCEPGWDDGTQHNYPVGWAYSHWYVPYGLRRYGYDADATRIAIKWLRLLARKLAETGAMWERYNVVNPDEPAAGRYPIQEGFGWTNSVFAASLVRLLFGVEPDMLTGEFLWDPNLPEAWNGKSARLYLPTYPWPSGIIVDCTNWPDPCTIDTPPDQNIALGKPVTASNALPTNPPELAVDGDLETHWGAGSGPPQWIEVDLQAPFTIDQIRLAMSQFPDGETGHRVWGKGPGAEASYRLLHEFSGSTTDRQVLEYSPPTPWKYLRFIKVETVQSPSWVSWREIEVYGDTTAVPAVPEHRIGIRVVDGVGEFYDRTTGEKFVPRGSNYDRWVWVDPPVHFDALFNTEFGQLDQAEEDLRKMHENGYNVVRVWINKCLVEVGGCIGDPTGGLVSEYLDNVAEFLRMAKRYGIYVMFTDDQVPEEGGYFAIQDPWCCEAFNGYNLTYLTPGGISANQRYLQDIIWGLIERDAPLDAILAYQLRNEAFFEAQLPPLTFTSGLVTTANGQTYDMANPEDRQRMMDEGWLYYIDQMVEAIKELDPTALVTMGFFAPQDPNIDQPRDPRLVNTGPILRESSLDFVDLHAYPGFDDTTIEPIAERFELMGIEAKPIVMGEFGAVKEAMPSLEDAAMVLQRWQVESCAYGFDGWFLWTWGSSDAQPEYEFWGTVEGEEQIYQALAPAKRPDPCQPGPEVLNHPNLAYLRPVTASNFEEPIYQPEKAVDLSLWTWWSSGAEPPQWIEIDLEQPTAIGGIRLSAGWVAPLGFQRNRVWVKGPGTGGEYELLHEFETEVELYDVLEYILPEPMEGVRYVKVETLESDGWVIWHEIEVLSGE